MAGEQHALDGALALGQRRLERAAALGEARRLGRQAALFRCKAGERAIGLRNGPLRGAQRVPGFLAGFLLLLQLLRQGVDARAQRLEVFFLAGGKAIERSKSQDKKRELPQLLQALAFPWLATAAVRLAISSASPR